MRAFGLNVVEHSEKAVCDTNFGRKGEGEAKAV
jgi:hypothetical protein